MASLIDTVVGHEEQKQMLLSAVTSNSLPHALVFAGPAGIGKLKLAKAFALDYLCDQFSLRLIQPQGLQIKIDQVREILEYLSFASDGQKRVIIIDQAHTMNAQASNALLKTLEEPPPDVFFILITTDVRLLMPTIRSRSQIIAFKALAVHDLQKINPGLSSWMYKSARGQAEKLNEFSEPEALEKRNSDLAFFEHFWSHKNFILETDIKEFAKDRVSASALLKNWFVFTRDLIVFSQGERDQVLNSDQTTTLLRLNFIPQQKLFDFSSALLQAIKDIDKLDMTLLFESLWVKHARAD